MGFGVRYCLKEKLEKVLAIFPAISATFIIFICSLVSSDGAGLLHFRCKNAIIAHRFKCEIFLFFIRSRYVRSFTLGGNKIQKGRN